MSKCFTDSRVNKENNKNMETEKSDGTGKFLKLEVKIENQFLNITRILIRNFVSDNVVMV